MQRFSPSLVALGLWLAGLSGHVGIAAPVPIQARAFPLDRVQLLPGPFTDPGKRDGFFDAAYAIPPGLSHGKREVTMRLVASAGRSGTSGLRVVEISAVTDAQWKEGLAP